MRRSFLPVLGALALLILAGCTPRTGPLVGSWELISNDGILPPEGAVGNQDEPPLTKILNETHFAFGRQVPEQGPWSGGGSYEFDGATYTEYIEYHALPEMVGMTIEFQCRLEDDLWYHQTKFEANGRWFHINEIWQRIEE